MPDYRVNKISTGAVKKTTGKGWDEWIELLDKLGAKKMIHKDIAQMLYDKKYIKSGWWSQMVTVGYEYARGKRTIGETEEMGFEIGAQKTLSLSPKQVWKILLSPKGQQLWLGKVNNFEPKKGLKFESIEGTKGELRTVTTGQKLRLALQPKGWKKSSTLQIYILPSGTNKTSLRFHQEKLKSKEMREKMRKH